MSSILSVYTYNHMAINCQCLVLSV